MSSIVGEVEVLVRPSTAGFEAEATPGITQAGTNLGKKLGKAVLAGFAIGGVYEGIKSVVEAATAQNTAFAVLDQTLKNAGLSVTGFSASLHDKLEVQARATGVSAEDLAAAMNRLVPATGSASKSLKDLNTAIGISESFHISLSTAALALAKAETGSFTSLQRYLGLIPKVTTAEDALHAKYTALTEAGGKLDASQKAQYESALKVAQAQDRQLTSQQALATATQKFGGIAQTFADTYQGQFDRLHVAVEQLKVGIGTELVGGLAAGAGGLANYIDKLDESDRVQKEVHTQVESLKGAFVDIKNVAQNVGPPILALADDFGGLAKVGETLAVVFGANKILTYIGGIGAVEATTATATASLAGSVGALTAALVANTDALTVNQAAAAKSTVIYDAYGGTLATVATEETAATAAATGLGAESVAAAGSVGIFAGAIGKLKVGLLEYLAVYEGIKNFVPGEKDLGLDFSNSTAGFVKGANGSPYQKNSTNDLLYQAGQAGEKGPILHLADGATSKLATLGAEGAKAYAAGFTAGLGGLTGPNAFGSGFKSAFDQAIAGNTNLSKATVAAKAHDAASAAMKATIQGLKDGVTADQSDLALIKQNLADAVTQGAQAVIDAVNQAKQNLNSIGGSLSAEIQSILVKPITDAQQQITAAQDKLSLATSKTTLRNLGESVLLPGGKQLSADPATALRQLQALEKKTGSPALAEFIQQYQSSFLSEKSAGLTVANDTFTGIGNRTSARLSNLTDAFNTGRITKGQLGGRLKSLLANLGITPAAAAREFGISGADTLTGLEQGLIGQAGAIATGPQRAGSGLVPSITRPLQTLHQQNREINQLRHEEATKSLDEQKKQTKLQQDIKANTATRNFVSSLDRNPGGASKRAAALTGTGG